MQIQSPRTSADRIRRLLKEVPFLDLEWLFAFDIGALTADVHKAQPRTDPLSFEDFKARRAAEREEVVNVILQAMHGDDGSILDDLAASEEYVTDLRADQLTPALLVAHYDRLAVYVERAIARGSSSFAGGSFLRSLLAPAMRWADSQGLPEVAPGIMDRVDEAIAKVHRAIQAQGLHPTLLDSQSRFIFGSCVLGAVLHVGVHPTVTSEHLHCFRLASAAEWAAVPPLTRVRYATLLVHLMMAAYDIDEPFKSKQGYSVNTLADYRSVLDDAAGAVLGRGYTAYQWVFAWFRDKLDTEVFSSRGWSTERVLSDVERGLVVELARRFAGYRFPVTVHHIEEFVGQFETTARIRGALRLLMHCRYFPMWELAGAMELLLRQALDQSGEELVVAPLGDQTGSTAIIRYLAAHSALEGRLRFVDDVRAAIRVTKAGQAIYFIDDCLLSGTQTLNILRDLMGTRERKAHHSVHAQALDRAERDELLSRRLVFCYCVATDFGERRFTGSLPEAGLDPGSVEVRAGVRESLTSKAFAPLGPVAWASADERRAVETFAREVGYDILEGRARLKKWDDARRQESALGFSDFQRLLIFPYSVPKTTLTLLWERGNEGRPWVPLFPSE